MRVLVVCSLSVASFILVGCAAQKGQLWVRTDGQHMSTNPALEQQGLVDLEICKGEAEKSKLAAGQVHGPLVSQIDEDIRRADSYVGIVKGCMAQRGYMRVDADKAEAVAASFAATRKEREKAAVVGPGAAR